MKNILALVATLASLSVFAAVNDLLLTFSSTGPDTYADGTQVMDGECYALVWLPKDSAGIEIAADGTSADPAKGEIIVTASVAKGGRCPTVAFQLNAAFAEKYTGGSWALYLLDTRKVDESGKVTLAGVTNGRATAVNAAGIVAASSVQATSKAKGVASASSTAATSATTSATSVVPAGAPQPKVKGIRVEGGLVYITVADTVPYLQYNLAAGSDPAALDEANAANNPVNGKAGEDIILVAPANEKAGFFRVGRN